MFRCERSTGRLLQEVRDFDTYAEAFDFCLKEGDHSRLWSLDEIDGSVEANNEASWDRIYGHGTISEAT